MTQSALRVCFVSHSAELSGAELSMLTLMRYLGQQGHALFAVLPSKGPMQPHLQQIGVEHAVIAFPRWSVQRPQKPTLHDAAHQIADQLRQWNIQVVYSNTTVIEIGAVAATFAGLPHVWHPREFIDNPVRYRFADPPATVVHCMSALSNAIICTSEALAAEYRPHVPAAKVHVVHDAVEVAHPQPDPPLPAGLQVDVILPFHNDPTTIDCLRSLIRHRTPTLGQVHVIDDGTSNAAALQPVRECIAEHPDLFRYSRHETAQGFVHTVNEGMQQSQRDVVLLNTDTVVTAGWLDRLAAVAHSSDDIATVTPLSNNATIYSVPTANQDNPLEDPDPVAQVVAATAPVPAIETFTAHGFCMYIRRQAMERAGLFDAQKYGRGYGEENDFSMRCRKLGLRNMVACRAFVLHRGSKSFGDEQRLRLIQENKQKLLRDHPDYPALQRAWQEQDPLQSVQASVAALQGAADIFTHPRLIVVGAVLPAKGQLQVVQALALLHQAGIRAHLMIVGPPANPDYEQAVRQATREEGLDAFVHWFGFVAQPQRLIQWADATVVACAIESFGRVTVESMTLGTPVVAARGGGTLELVRDGQTALLYEPGNVADLARQLTALLRDPARRAQLSDAARAAAAKMATFEDHGSRIADLLRHVAQQPPALGKWGATLGDLSFRQQAQAREQELQRIKTSKAWRLIEKSWRWRRKLANQLTRPRGDANP